MRMSSPLSLRVRQAWILLCVLAAAGCQSRPVVAIVTGNDPDAMVARAIQLAGGLDGIVHDGDHVVIKPNLTWVKKPANPKAGVTTDIRVTAAVIDAVRKAADCRVTIAEAGGTTTKVVFDAYGYTTMARERGVPLVDIRGDERMTVWNDKMHHPEYTFPKTVRTCDVFIDVPVLKTHQLSGVTVGMKNLYCLLPEPKGLFHDEADEALCDMATIRKPDMVIVDGLVGMEGNGPIDGEPITMNLVIAGKDLVAVDAVATAVMGHDPATVSHIQLAHARGLGECDLSKIEIRGEPIEKVRKVFKAPRCYPVTLPISEQQERRLVRAFSGRSVKSDVVIVADGKYPTMRRYPFTCSANKGSASIQSGCDVFERPALLQEFSRWLTDSQALQIRPAGAGANRALDRRAVSGPVPRNSIVRRTTGASTQPATPYQ